VAEELVLSGVQVKRRHPWGVWALSIITLGIYHLVWWYKINRELRDYSAAAGAPLGNSPGVSLLALFPGGLLIIPPFWSIATTCGRIRHVHSLTDGRPASSPSGVLAILISFILALNIPYIQYGMNDCWRQAELEPGERGGPSGAPGTRPAA